MSGSSSITFTLLFGIAEERVGSSHDELRFSAARPRRLPASHC